MMMTDLQWIWVDADVGVCFTVDKIEMFQHIVGGWGRNIRGGSFQGEMSNLHGNAVLRLNPRVAQFSRWSSCDIWVNLARRIYCISTSGDGFPVAAAAVPSLPALGPWAPRIRTGPLATKYLPGFPYSWSLRRFRQKISSINCTVICNYPSAAQVDQTCTASVCTIIQ